MISLREKQLTKGEICFIIIMYIYVRAGKRSALVSAYNKLCSARKGETMVNFLIGLAKKTVEVKALYSSTKDFCRGYLIENAIPDISVTVTPPDIAYERRRSAEERALEGLSPHEFPAEYLETLALYRKIAEALVPHGIILFHGSSLSVDGKGLIFTAKSGTGKSTHTRIWRRVYGERVKMINDDKPLLGITDEGVTVYGTPWCGKHALGENTSAPLHAVSVIERSFENRISPLGKTEALLHLLSQTYRPRDGALVKTTLSLLDKLLSRVKVYRLGVNMEDGAAIVAYRGMLEEGR